MAFLLSSALALSAATLFAQPAPLTNTEDRTEAPLPAPEAPPAEMKLLEAFIGTWTCQGHFPASDNPERATRATLTITRDLDGFWYSGRETFAKASPTDRPLARVFYWTFDSLFKQFVGGWLDNRGLWLTHMSRGWQNDKLVFDGHLQTAAARRSARETFTRPDASGFTRTFETMSPDLQWTTIAEETCHKGKPGKH